MPTIRVGLAQINTVVGDLPGNVARILEVMGEAEAVGCDVLALPELAVTGYPPEDLLLRPSFVRDNLAAIDEVVAGSRRCVTVVGFVDSSSAHDQEPARAADAADGEERSASAPTRPVIYNAAAVCAGGELIGCYRKRVLPNYSVFDEQRYFTPGDTDLTLVSVAGVAVGVSICEDAWTADGPIAELGRGGAGLVVNLNASPYNVGKAEARLAVVRDRAAESGATIAYVNQVGGQDELIFDGDSMVVAPDGTVLARAAQFTEGLVIVDVEVLDAATTAGLAVVAAPSASPASRPAVDPVGVAPRLPEIAEVWDALVLGTRDFVRKNGFADVVIGLSGGIDSALVAAIAVGRSAPTTCTAC